MTQTLTKRSGESRTYIEDLSLLPEMVAGDTVASVTSVVASIDPSPTPAPLPISNIVVASGSKGAQFRISGGLPGITYKITTTVLTTGGSILEGVGFLTINDD